MRILRGKEADALLAASESGTLDLRTIPNYIGGIPPVKYAECTKDEDGTITWEARHLPIPSKSTYDIYCNARVARQHIIKLTKDERTEMIKAYIKGEIEDEALPRIYPLNPKPFLASVLYKGFKGAHPSEVPLMPLDWCMQFDSFIHGKPMAANVIWFFDEPKLYERGEYQEELKPYDWSTNQPIEPSMMYFYDSLALSIVLWLHK